MSELLAKSLTYEDYLNLPDDGNRYELIDGELYMTPAPDSAHQYVSSEIEWHMQQFVRARKLGVGYHAPYEVHLPGASRIVQPDLLFIFIRSENAPTADDRYFAGVPDLVVEIVSLGSSRTDRYLKFGIYESAGIPEYWIVDPRGKSVTVYVLNEGEYAEWVQAVGDEMITSRLLSGLEIPNSGIFLKP